MTETTHDPVHRVRYAVERDGDDLIVDTWMEPGGALPEHMHPRQEERWSVVEGEARLQVGKERRVVRPEDGEVVVAARVRHALEGVGDHEAHLRCRVIPALDLEQFLTDSAAAAREGLFTRGGIPRSLRGARWAANFLARHRECRTAASGWCRCSTPPPERTRTSAWVRSRVAGGGHRSPRGLLRRRDALAAEARPGDAASTWPARRLELNRPARSQPPTKRTSRSRTRRQEMNR